jgi:hypothetical protein
MDESQQESLAGYLYDGLDDLYDQRFGARQQSAEVWLARLLFAASIAYSGDDLEPKLLNAADSIQATLRSRASTSDRLDAALKATDQLRLDIYPD